MFSLFLSSFIFFYLFLTFLYFHLYNKKGKTIKQICDHIKLIYSVTIREAFNEQQSYKNDQSKTVSELLQVSNAMFNAKTLERIFRTLVRGYLIPEFNLFRVKFYQRPCFEWSVDAAGSIWNKLWVKGICKIFFLAIFSSFFDFIFFNFFHLFFVVCFF